jgi:hypothetical protein
MSIPAPVIQAFIATLFTWGIPALGTAMMGFAAGVKTPTSF